MKVKAFIASLIQYYERVLAVVVMLLLVVSFAILVFRVGNLRTRIAQDDGFRPTTVEPKLSSTQQLKDSLDLLNNPPSWGTNISHRVFIAPYMKVLDPAKGRPERTDPIKLGGALSVEGLPFKWLKEHGLSTKAPVADTDPDNDSFTVREEYQAGTDPKDPLSKPDLALKLRVARVFSVEVPFTFKGLAEGTEGLRFILLRRDGKKSYFVKMNEPIPIPDKDKDKDKELVGWRAVDYKEKFEEKENRTIRGPDGNWLKIKVDVSELTMQRNGDKPVVLAKNRPGTTEELRAQLYFILEGRYFEVGMGNVFSLQDTKYQVVGIKELDGKRSPVVVKKQDTENEFPLLVLTEEELHKIKTPSTTPSPAGFPSPFGPTGFPLPPTP